MEVSNSDRIVFPEDGITKGEVFAYYESVTDLMLPFVVGRALTVERYPKGVGEKGFMQKNAPDHLSSELIDRHEVEKEDGGITRYPVVRSGEAIPAFANLGVITFHVPPTTVDAPSRSDWIIWDLDPPPGELELAREAALAVRVTLEAFDLDTVVMTSGSNGYHLRTALRPAIPWDRAAFLARGTAALAMDAHPDLLTLSFRKKERGERVFLDWLRNAPYSTSVVPWSLRARPGAPVAVPIAWDEIAEIAPNAIGMRHAGDRLGLEPWGVGDRVDVSGLSERVELALAEAGIALEPFDRFRS